MPFEALLTVVPLIAVASLAVGALYIGYTVASCATARLHNSDCPSA